MENPATPPQTPPTMVPPHPDGLLLAVTHTDPLTFKRCSFVGHACAVRSLVDVQTVATYLRTTPPWVGCTVRPCAWRLEGDEAAEGFDDFGDLGAGRKLLGLLQRWDVRNVVLSVTRHDDRGLPGGAFLAAERLGVQRYRVILGRAKDVLEQCYLATLRNSTLADLRVRDELASDSTPLSAAPSSRYLPAARAPNLNVLGVESGDDDLLTGAGLARCGEHRQSSDPPATSTVAAGTNLAVAKMMAARPALRPTAVPMDCAQIFDEGEQGPVAQFGAGTKRGRVNHFQYGRH